MSKRPRSPSPLSLYTFASNGAFQQQPPPLLSLNIHNTYHNSILYESEQRDLPLLKKHMQKGGDLGYVEVGVETVVPNVYGKHYIYVMDTSGSMSNGNRMVFAKMGLEASCKMIAGDARVTVIGFDSTATVLYSGPNPNSVVMDEMAETQERDCKMLKTQTKEEDKTRTPTMNRILKSLIPQGGTNIVDALRLTTLECKKYLPSAEGEEMKSSVTILLMTDGEDSNMADMISRQMKMAYDDVMACEEFLKKMHIETISDISGIQMHIVGISQDASACDLAFLAEKAGGTFVCVKNDDIIDVMGTLLGFVEEKIPNMIVLDFSANTPHEGFTLLEKHNVQLVTSKTSKVAFKLPLAREEKDAEALGMWDAVQMEGAFDLVAKLYVVPLGLSVRKYCYYSPSTQEIRKQMTLVDSASDATHANTECIVQEAYRLWGEYNSEVSIQMYGNRGSMSSKCMDLNRIIREEVSTLKDYFFTNVHDVQALNELEVVLALIETQYQELRRCMLDRTMRVEVEQRILSNASTHRNYSVSLDPLMHDDDSSTPISRVMSDSQLQARDRIRTISSTLTKAFEQLCTSSGTKEDAMD